VLFVGKHANIQSRTNIKEALAMKLDRIVFACDLNANYIQFWPLVSRVWAYVTGARPTLFFIAPLNTPIENVPGSEIIYVPPPPDIPTCFIAQTIRLLAPTWFPNQVCVVSDIDLMVVNRSFFPRHIGDKPSDALVILNRYPPDIGHCSLSYHVARGSTFAKVFQVPEGPKEMGTVMDLLRQWYKNGQGQWGTDESVIYQKTREFQQKNPGKVIEIFTPNLWKNPFLSVTHYAKFQLNPRRISQYIEVEPPYPYLANRNVIHAVLGRLLPQLDLSQIKVLQPGVVRPNRHPHKSVSGQKVHSAMMLPRPLVRRRLVRR